MGRSFFTLLALGLLPVSTLACGRAEPVPTPDPCPHQLWRLQSAARASPDPALRLQSRARLELLARRWVRLAERCAASLGGEPQLALAELREAIARISRDGADLRTSLAAWATLAEREGDSALGARATWRRARLALDHDRRRLAQRLLAEVQQRQPDTPEGRRAAEARVLLGAARLFVPAAMSTGRALPPDPAARTITGRAVDPDRLGIRFAPGRPPARLLRLQRWSTPRFTRVVAAFSHPVRYLHGVIPRRGAQHARIYLDFPSSQLSPSVLRAQAEQDHLVTALRVADRPPSSSRLVLELSGPVRYQIYPFLTPYRVVVDLWVPGSDPTARVAAGAAPASSITLRRVALDPGHGGDNQGAVGPSGLLEKEVTLEVARRAARLLEAAGVQVVLTREGDHAVSLEERSAIALATGADLFVSIHANAEPRHTQAGVETYYLDVGGDAYATRLAARENQAAGQPADRYRLLLADLTTRALTARSQRLASALHARLLAAARQSRPDLPDRGVRRAIFHVLLTARVPGVLAEVSFISHPQGEAALRRPDYLQSLATGIAQGVLDYARGK